MAEVGQGFFANVWNIARDLFRTELGIAGAAFELLDVDRGVGVLPHQPLADQDRVLEVVAAPGHERHQHVATQRQLALLAAGTVGQNLAFLHFLPALDHRGLVETGRGVGAHKLAQVVHVNSLGRVGHQLALALG